MKCSVAVVGGRRGFKGVVSSSAISRSGRLTCRIQAAVQRVGGGPRRQGEPPGVGRSKATLTACGKSRQIGVDLRSTEWRRLGGMAMGKKPAARQPSPMWGDHSGPSDERGTSLF